MKRKKSLFGKIRQYLNGFFNELARQNGSEIVSGHIASDYVYVCVIPPKYAVCEVIRYLKDKSAVAVARQYGGKNRNFSGQKLWARRYAVLTVGFKLEKVK